MRRFGFLFAVCLTVTAFEDNAPLEREKEVYRIYSLLMTDPPTSHGPDDNPRYLIGGKTRAENQSPCVRPPKERQSEFAEVLTDFETRRKTTRTLKREFSLRKQYELMNEEEVKAFQSERRWPKPEAREKDARFRGVTDLFTFSDVYFSRNGRLALTAMSSWCNSLCALHQWKVLEKLPTGEWREHPSWVSCLTIAREFGKRPTSSARRVLPVGPSTPESQSPAPAAARSTS